jgi:hypothetical protein
VTRAVSLGPLVRREGDNRAGFRGSWVVAIVIATALVWAPNAFAGDGIRTYPTCVAFEQRPDRDATCVQGDAWGGVLIAKREDLRYNLCVRGPGDDDCKRKKARQGKPSAVAFFRDTVGTYHLKWKADGRVLDKDRVRVRSEGV